MWRVLKTFVDEFKNRIPLPYEVSVKWQQLSYKPLSKEDNRFVQFSFIVFVLHTVYCFLRLMWVWKTGFRNRKIEQQDLEIIRIYLLSFLTFLPLTFAPIGFVVAERPGIILNIVNPVSDLRKSAYGNFEVYVLKIYNSENSFIYLLYGIISTLANNLPLFAHNFCKRLGYQ